MKGMCKMNKRNFKSILAILLSVIISVVAFPVTVIATEGDTTIYDLQTEYMTTPLGTDETAPRFSWKMQSSAIGECQTAYRITVATDEQMTNVVWNSGKVVSDASVGIEYEGEALLSRTRYYWTVEVWNKDGVALDKATSWFETALLNSSDWSAKRIGISNATSAEMLRRAFNVNGEVKSARLYSTALGLYEANINGQKVGNDYLNPGWTDYRYRVQYQTFDITDMLTEGENVIGVTLGNGWFSGHISTSYKLYGSTPSFFGQIEITYADGSVQTIASDSSWTAYGDGPLTADDLQNGTTYDARKATDGWDKAGFDDSSWSAAEELEWTNDKGESYGTLVAQPCPTVKAIKEITPVSVTLADNGNYIVNMGQNFAGICKLNVPSCDAGTTITLVHGETLTSAGLVYTGNLNYAKQTDSFISNGKAFTFEPQFTYHGFQYVEISGYPTTLTVDDIKGLVLSTDLDYTGTFNSSNNNINKLYSANLWSQYSNFNSVPTDCPQRSERSGWLGDMRIFGDTAAYNANTNAYITKWMNDIRDTLDFSIEEGAIPDVAPKTNFYPGALEGSTAWGDAALTLVWGLYNQYGDIRTLEENYDIFTGWLTFYLNNSENYIYTPTDSEYGDWLSCDDGKGTPTAYVGTVYFYQSAQLTAMAAEALGYEEDAAYYADLANKVKAAFADEFVVTSGLNVGVVGTGSQTSYSLALYMDLVPEKIKPYTIQRYINLVSSDGYKMRNGYSSMDAVLPGLSDMGYNDIAYNFLFNGSLPGWIYVVDTMGKNTFAESWWVSHTASYNHYAQGCVAEWLYSYVLGIKNAQDSIGFKHIKLAPTLDSKERLTYASGSYDSVYGTISSSWAKTSNGVYSYDISVPANTTATVTFPKKWVKMNGIDIANLTEANGIVDVRLENGLVVCDVLSGSYSFTMSDEGTDKEASEVDAVVKAIASLEDVWSITAEDANNIANVKADYDDLTPSAQASVSNADSLLALYNEVSILVSENDDGFTDSQKASSFAERRIDEIDDIVDLTADDKAQITKVKEYYDTLTDDEKALVSNRQHLFDAIALIDALPDSDGASVTLEYATDSKGLSYVKIPAGVTVYVGDTIYLPKGQTFVSETMSGAVINYNTSTSWSGFKQVPQGMRMTAVGNVTLYCLTMGTVNCSINMGTIEVKAHATTWDIADAIEVNNAINALDPANTDYNYFKSNVKPLREKYNALHSETLSVVTAYDKLLSIEKSFVVIAANDIDNEINSLPEYANITPEDAASIAAIRNNYESLSDESKALVTKLGKLINYEKLIELYPAEKTVQLEVNNLKGPENNYLKVPDGVKIYAGDSISAPKNHSYTTPNGSLTGSILTFSITNTYSGSWQNGTKRLTNIGSTTIYCLDMWTGSAGVNTSFKLVTFEVSKRYTFDELVAAVQLKDDIDASDLSAKNIAALKARYNALNEDIRDQIVTNAHLLNSLKGDLNGDFIVDSSDLILIKQLLIGITKMDADTALLADLNGDGKVSAVDYLQMELNLLGY